MKHKKSKYCSTETLCWKCKKSTGCDNCPWVNEFTPVEGWAAEATKIKVWYGYEDSFKVLECPLFEEG